jgi:MFS family permease
MKNKINYLFGIFISGFGDGIQQIAMIWYIYHLTREATSIGLMIAIYYLPSMVITPFVSVYVDHRDSKNIVVLTDMLRFVLVLCMAVLIFFKVESSLIFYVLQFLLAVCYTIYKPASQSFIKESFSDQDIPFVLSKSASLNEASMIAGTGLSGILLIKMSIEASFFINSLTFLIASILFLFMKRIQPKQIIGKKIIYLLELLAGWNFINQKDGMKYLMYLSILNSISIQMTTTLLLPLATQFHGSSGLYSFFEIAFAVGGILSGLIVTFFLKKLRQKIIIFTMTGMMISSLLLFLNPFKVGALLLIFSLGFFTMSHLITIQTLIQLNTPKNYIGRVIGLRTILASFVKISSALMTGILISKIGVNHILLSFSVFILISFLTLKHMKKVYIPANL